MEDRIVKAPLIVHQVDKKDPDKVTRKNVIEAYGDWLIAALERWKEHYKTYKRYGPKPVLFIMAEKNPYADEIGRWLTDPANRTGLKESEVLVIHTDSEGEITKKDLEEARQVARDIDLPTSKTKAIVSVLMLREGWDVQSVSIALGLRPFTSKARILPEQTVGRGLRLMQGISPDRTQTLEVMGTEAFEEFVRQLETEGVGIRTVTKPPAPPVNIEPVLEKIEYDIAIPLTKPMYAHNYRRLSSLTPESEAGTSGPLTLEPIYESKELEEPLRIRLKMEFATTETEVHRVNLVPGVPLIPQELLASITHKVIAETHLEGVFAQLYPLVQTYVTKRCFGREIDLEDGNILNHLRAPMLQQGIARYLARKIGELTLEERKIEFEERSFKLSETKPFTWRRKKLICEHTIFNYVATYNDFEARFAEFLDRAPDIFRFAALAEHFTRFCVNYLSPAGALKFYYPDFVAVQRAADGGELNWIIETKGRVWEGTENEDAAISAWCRKVSEQTDKVWRYVRIAQTLFEEWGRTAVRPYNFGSLANAVGLGESDDDSHTLGL